MAQVDTGIYSSLLQPPKSLIGYSNELDQADASRQQLASQKLNLIGAQRNLDEEQAVRDVYKRPDFDPTSSASLPALYAASPKAGVAAQKAMFDSQKTQAEVSKLTTETKGLDYDQSLKRKNEHLKQLVTVSDVPGAVGWISDAVKSGELPADQAQQVISGLQSGQIPVSEWRQKAMLGGLTSQEALTMTKPVIQTRDTGGQVQTLAIDPMTGKPTVTGSVGKTISPDAALSASTSRSNNAASIVKDYAIAGLDANGKDTGGDGGLSPAAIENAAARYNTDGTMPTNIGRGAQGARDLRKIQNRAAELAMGTDPTQLRVNQLDTKSAGAALTQLTKAKTMSASFEDTANQNADLALSLSKKNDRTGIPMLNAGLQAWRTGTGSPEATQFAAANETFVNEYAKIMSGGMGNGPVSDSARNKAHTLLTTGMTDGQYEGNVRLLQKEMKNRMAGFDNQEKALKARMGGKSAAPEDASAHPPDIQSLIDKYGKK